MTEWLRSLAVSIGMSLTFTLGLCNRFPQAVLYENGYVVIQTGESQVARYETSHIVSTCAIGCRNWYVGAMVVQQALTDL